MHIISVFELTRRDTQALQEIRFQLYLFFFTEVFRKKFCSAFRLKLPSLAQVIYMLAYFKKSNMQKTIVGLCTFL